MDLGVWICDRCRQPIKKPEHGWVEWLTYGQGTLEARGLRLVHHAPFSPLKPRNCQYDQEVEYKRGFIISDGLLSEFLGPDGLMYLLSWLAEGRLPKEEIIELIKRLHVPGYEFARLGFDAAIEEGILEPPNSYPGYYSQSQIDSVINWLRGKEEHD